MVLRLDLKIFLLFILYYFTRQIKIYSIIMIFAIIHELSHLIAGLLLNMKVKKIEIMPIGLSIEFSLKMGDYNKKILKSNKLELKKIIVASAGPLINIVIIMLAWIIPNNEISSVIIYSNLIIAIFNLLPIYPLDGGRILKSILNLYLGRRKSESYMNIISNIFLSFISMIFSIMIYYFKNMGLLFILIYLCYIVIKQDNIYKMKSRLYKIMEENIYNSVRKSFDIN